MVKAETESAERAWRRIGAICREMVDDLPHLIPAIVATIRAEIPNYAVVPVTEHERHMAEHSRSLLHGLAERRPPNAEEIDEARTLGRARAQQGIPVELLLGAYHVMHRELWNELVRRTQATDPELAVALVQTFSVLWTWIRGITTPASESYAEALRSRHVTEATLRHRFLDALTAVSPDLEAAVPLAHALGYQPDGRFRALCLLTETWPDDRLDRLQGWLSVLRGRVHSAPRGLVTIVLTQQADTDQVVREIKRADEHCPVGVGLERPGLSGATASIADAEHALDIAERTGGTSYFDRDWLAASLSRQAGRLTPLFDDAVRAAKLDPHLAEAVRAFAEHGLSVAAAARALHLHPNSVSYRLERWRDRTGWDPRSGDGLVASLTALALYRPQADRPATARTPDARLERERDHGTQIDDYQ
ncbi:hypothetical protein GCM10012275_48770 [Longimycelium tulufanense]|uniref:PucR C-terminal helix-turn-helix domain-containing protein n=1 Tax=Longimycelium tulufanense TaxID=907463 RepID=A0A8J3CC59_9PSEU|nr:helix-turn-helix domain-containing protein [Longimycelium tulufanense]GGM72443.1 hypothetical protein GCM10012275_48770 [Longimycelium tulufanense]